MSRFIPLPPDISYCLDCAQDGLHVTSDVGTFFECLNPLSIAREWDERDLRVRDMTFEESFADTGDWFTDIFTTWFYSPAASASAKAWCMRSAVLSTTRSLGEGFDFLYSKYVSDALARSVEVPDRDSMYGYLNESFRFREIERRFNGVIERLEHIDQETVEDALSSPTRFWGERVLADMRGSNPKKKISVMDKRGNVQAITQRAYLRKVRAKRKEDKKVLRKSSDFLKRLVGAGDLLMLVKGGAIEVVGERFSFVVKMSNYYSTHHGALQITVKYREIDTELFDLCWYVPETPAFDQLSALVMAVKSGNEDEIIKIGNAYNVRYALTPKHVDAARKEAVLGSIIADLMDKRYSPNFLGLPPISNESRDREMHYTIGTHDYMLNNANTYRDFFEVCSSSLRFDRVPSYLQRRLREPRPDEIRRIDGEKVACWNLNTMTTTEEIAMTVNEGRPPMEVSMLSANAPTDDEPWMDAAITQAA